MMTKNQLKIVFYSSEDALDDFLCVSQFDNQSLYIYQASHPSCQSIQYVDTDANNRYCQHIFQYLSRDACAEVKAFTILSIENNYKSLRRLTDQLNTNDSKPKYLFMHAMYEAIYLLGLSAYYNISTYKLDNAKLVTYDMHLTHMLPEAPAFLRFKNQESFSLKSHLNKLIFSVKFHLKELIKIHHQLMTTQLKSITRLDKTQIHQLIVFVCHDSGTELYTTPYWPIFDLLKEKGIPFKILALDHHVEKQMKERGYPCEVYDLSTKGPLELEKNIRSKLRNEIPDGQAIDPVFSYIVEIIKNSHQINNQASYIASLKYFLEEHLQGAKAVVLVPDGTPAAMLAATIAHQQEAQTYTMLAASISEEFSTFIYCVAQNIFVYGEQPKKVLEAVMHNKRFLYSGNTKMYCYTKSNLSKNYAYTILIATSRYSLIENQWIQEVIDNSSNDIQIIVKPHPAYPDIYNSLTLNKWSRLALANEPIEQSVAEAHLVITDHSQVGRDAYLLHKPVISMLLDKKPIYLKNIPGIIYCQQTDDLLQKIESFYAKGKGYKHSPDPKFVTDYNYFNDDKHYERVIQQLLSS